MKAHLHRRPTRVPQGISGHVALGIFARAPIPGRTKTRLIPLLGPNGAADFHRAALLDTIDLARDVLPRVSLFLTPIAHRTMVRRIGVTCAILPQGGGSLGTRMAHALDQLLRPREIVGAMLIGTDSPDLPRTLLRQAIAALGRAPSVLLPVADGGFALIGVRRDARAKGQLEQVLKPVDWSSPETSAQTVRVLSTANLAPVLLGSWFDVDEPADVLALRDRCARPRRGEPHPARTAKFLAALESRP